MELVNKLFTNSIQYPTPTPSKNNYIIFNCQNCVLRINRMKVVFFHLIFSRIFITDETFLIIWLFSWTEFSLREGRQRFIKLVTVKTLFLIILIFCSFSGCFREMNSFHGKVYLKLLQQKFDLLFTYEIHNLLSFSASKFRCLILYENLRISSYV